MEDLSYFLEKIRGQAVQHSDLVRIIKKHKGNPRHLDEMVEKHQESMQWEWYDKYQEHLEELAEVVSHNAGTTLDEEGVEVSNEPECSLFGSDSGCRMWVLRFSTRK